MVAAVAFNVRSYIFILNLMYDANMCTLKCCMRFGAGLTLFHTQMNDYIMCYCFNDALLSIVNACEQYLVIH